VAGDKLGGVSKARVSEVAAGSLGARSLHATIEIMNERTIAQIIFDAVKREALALGGNMWVPQFEGGVSASDA